MYSVSSTHNLIDRSQNYLAARKLVTIHSIDRDIRKWPKSNNFEVRLPQAIQNVQYMRLANISIPNTAISYSVNNQNTKLSFSLSKVGVNWDATLKNQLALAVNLVIELQEGSYTCEEMANALTYLMNAAVTNYLSSAHGSTYKYDKFLITCNETNGRLIFGNTIDEFTIHANTEQKYDNDCGVLKLWNNYSEWGLPFYLGFEKSDYKANAVTGSSYLYYRSTPEWIVPSGVPASNRVYIIDAPNMYVESPDRTIYMEVDRFNSIDEIAPYSVSTSSTYNNDYHGRVDSSFAKISLSETDIGKYIYNSRNDNLQNVKIFTPVQERIDKLKFTFRYHNGVLVDFGRQPFNFTIEFMTMDNEILRQTNVRAPLVYGL